MVDWKRLVRILLVVLAVLVGVLLTDSPEAQTVGLTISWTAPGDDGLLGRASQYDLRYSKNPIAGTDTLSWWNAATQASGEPLPSISGATDSLRVLGLIPSTTYWFIVRAADDGLPAGKDANGKPLSPIPNWSGYSNVAIVLTPDTVPPAAVADLRGSP